LRSGGSVPNRWIYRSTVSSLEVLSGVDAMIILAHSAMIDAPLAAQTDVISH
jgi:hypothetical protein